MEEHSGMDRSCVAADCGSRLAEPLRVRSGHLLIEHVSFMNDEKRIVSLYECRSVMCCVCHRVHTEEGWVFQPDVPGVIHSHGYCPACYAKVMAELNESFMKQPVPV